MLPSTVDRSWYKRFFARRLAHAVSAVVARCSLLLQQASDNSPSFR